MDRNRYDFEDYVDKQITLLQDGNAADFKPTYEAEIDDLKSRCEQLYAAGLSIVTSMSQTELDRCKKVFEIQEGIKRFDERQPADDFCEMRLEGKTIIARRYLSVLPVMQKLGKVLQN